MTILLAFITFYGSFVIGRRLINLLEPSAESREKFVIGSGLGLGVLAYAVLLLGLCHQLSFSSLFFILILFTIFLLFDVKKDFQSLANWIRTIKPPFVWDVWMMTAIGLIALIPAFLSIFVPDISNDSLCYHLHLPKLFLQEGKFYAVPYEVNALFPFLMEMLFTYGLGISGTHLAQSFQFWFGVLSVAIITCSVKSRVFLAMIAGLLFLTSPGILNQLPTTYVDVGISYFTIAAFYSLLRWLENRSRGWFVLFGVFSGLMMSIKYLSLVSIASFWVVIAWRLIREEKKYSFFFKHAFFYSLVVLITGGYWYIRSWIELGNPVYPYFYSIFGKGDGTIQYDDIGLPKTVFNLIKVPFMMAFSPKTFEGFGDQLGPAFLAYLPVAFWGIKSNKKILSGLIFIFTFWALWFFLGQSQRFFFPAWATIAFVIAQGFDFAPDALLKNRLFKSSLIFILLIHAGFGIFHYRSQYHCLSGKETAHDYLLKNERTFAPAEWANQNLPAAAKILSTDDPRVFFFKNSIVRETVIEQQDNYSSQVQSAQGTLQFMKSKGITHILWLRSPFVQKPETMAPFRVQRLLFEGKNELVDDLVPLYNSQFQDKDGNLFKYTLYSINS